MVLDLKLGDLVEEIESEGILVPINLLQEPLLESDPFLLTQQAFENRFLDAGPVIRAGPGDPSQATGSGLIPCGDIVGDEDEHGYFGTSGG
jgi:hypothetical protein